MAEAEHGTVIEDFGSSLPTLKDFYYNDLAGYDVSQQPASEKVLFYQEEPPGGEETLGYSFNGSLLSLKVPKTAFDLSVQSIVSNNVTGNSVRFDLSQAEYGGYDNIKAELEAFKNRTEMSGYYATIGADNVDLYERNGMKYAASLRLLFTNLPELPRFTATEVNEDSIIQKQYQEVAKATNAYKFCSVPYPYIMQYTDDGHNGLRWSCPNYNTPGNEKQQYNPTDILYFIQRNNVYYQVIPLDRQNKIRNVLVLNNDRSTPEQTMQGYDAKNILIDQLSKAKDIRVVLDRSSLQSQASTATYLQQYPLNYRDDSPIGNFSNYIKDLGNLLFDDTWYKYAGYVPYGLDKYHRLHGVIYVKVERPNPVTGQLEDVWYNLNKMAIAETNNMAAPSSSSSATDIYHIDYGPEQLKPYTYDYRNKTYVDKFWAEAGEQERKRRKTQVEIFHNTPLAGLFPSGQDDGYKTDEDVLYNWTVALGDVTFFIPPESIRVVSQNETDRLPLMRAKGSIAKSRERSQQYIELNLYFNDDRGINGVTLEQTAPNGKDKFTYKMNGFRALLAQMKFTPFLPIINRYINEVLGIYAVCIENINLSTVPGFPALLHAQLLLSKFNYTVYMPEIPEPDNDSAISDNRMNPFSACIDYDTMRWYYQRCIILGDELDRLMQSEDPAKKITVNSLEFYTKTIFANRTALLPYHFKDPTISVYIADEDHLRRLLQIKQDAARKSMNVSDNFEPDAAQSRLIRDCNTLTSNIDIQGVYAKYMGRAGILLSALDRAKQGNKERVEDGSGDNVIIDGTKLIHKDKTYSSMDRKDVNAFLDAYIYQPMLEEFTARTKDIRDDKDDLIVKSVSIPDVNTSFWLSGESGRTMAGQYSDIAKYKNQSIRPKYLTIELNANTYVLDSTRKKVAQEASVYFKNNGTKITVDPDDIFQDTKVALQLPYVNDDVDIYKTDVLTPVLQAIQKCYGSSALIDPDADKYASLLFLDWCRTTGIGIVDANDEAARLKQSIDYEDVHSLKYNPLMENVLVTQFSATVGNTYARIGVTGTDGSAPQYMGGQDTKLSWTIETRDEFIVSSFKTLPELTAYYARVYRRVLPAYPIKIDSEFSRMMGIQEVSIDNVVVSTVPQFPGLYQISVHATSVDRTLRNKEALKLLEIRNEEQEAALEKSRIVKQTNPFLHYRDIDKEFSKAEVYPDLELPKISELGKLGWRYIRYRTKERNNDDFYIDPDFYFVYPELIAGRALIESFRCTFEDELRDKISEEDITQYLTDTSGGQLKVAKNGGIDATSGNLIAQEDLKDREAIKIGMTKDSRFYYLDPLKSVLFRIPVGSWDISSQIRCVFMEPGYIREQQWTKKDGSSVKANNTANPSVLDVVVANQKEATLEAAVYTAGPMYEKVRLIDQTTRKEIEIRDNPNWDQRQNKKIYSKLSQFESCADELESYLKRNDDNLSFSTDNAKTAKYTNKPYTASFITDYFRDAGFWNCTGQYGIFGKKYETASVNFSSDDIDEVVTEYNTRSFAKKQETIAPLGYMIQAVADALYGAEECSSQTTAFGKLKWQADMSKIYAADGIVQYDEWNQEALHRSSSFGMFGIRKYTFSQLYQILPKEERKELEQSFEQDKSQFYVLDPHFRYKDNETKEKYLKNCATIPSYCATAFMRIVLWYFAKLLRYHVIPSMEFDIKRNENIDIADAHGKAKEWIEKNKALYEKNLEIYKKLKEYAQNNGEAFDAGKFFAAIILALTNEGFDKGSLFDFYNVRDYTGLNNLIKNVTANKHKDRNEQAPSVSQRNTLLRRYLLALYGYNVIPDPNHIGDDVQVSPAGKYVTDYNTMLALTACGNPAQYMRDSFYDMIRNDYRGRMLRAFPTFYMIFVDEGREYGLWKLYDNFYNTNAIHEIQIVKSRKIAADTCRIVLSNMFQTFTTNDEDCTINYKAGFGDLWDSFFNPKIAAQEATLRRLAAKRINKAKLQTGVRIHVRIGYGANAADLPGVFNGVIADIKPGAIVEITAQGDGVELCNPIFMEDTADLIKNADNFATFDKAVCGLPPKDILQGFLTAKGGPMAAWLRGQLRTNYYNGPKYKLFNHDTAKERSERLKEENEDKDSIFTGSMNLLNEEGWAKYALLNIFKNNPYGIRHFGDPEYREIFPQGEPAQNLYQITNRSNSVDAEDLSNHVYFGDGSLDLDDKLSSRNNDGSIDEVHGNLPYISFKPYGKTIWDIMHICKSIAPDYMTGIADFQFRSTVFLGKPHYYYAYKYALAGDDKTFYEKRKPFQQWHFYNNFYDIIDNKISASSEKMKTNASGVYEVECVSGTKKTDPMWVDQDIYPEYQKSMVVDTKLYGKSAWKHSTILATLGSIPLLGKVTDFLLGDIPAQFSNSWLDEHFSSWFDNRGSCQSHVTMAEDAVIDALKNSVKEMYQGYLIVLGDPSVKPNDRMYINDAYEDMNGLCDVREVVHTINAYQGFTTTLTPDCISAHDLKNEILKVNWASRLISRVSIGLISGLFGYLIGGNLVVKGSKILKNGVEVLKAVKVISKINTAKTMLNVISTGLSSSAPGAIARLIGTAVITLFGGAVNTALYRTIKGMQVLYIFPLKKYGKVFVAGVDGQQGLVYGSTQFNTPGPIEQLVGRYLSHNTENQGMLNQFLNWLLVDEQTRDEADRFAIQDDSHDFMRAAMTGDVKQLTEADLQSISGPQLDRGFSKQRNAYAMSMMPRIMVDGIQRSWMPSKEDNKKTIWQAVQNRYYIDNIKDWVVNPNLRNLVYIEENQKLWYFFESNFLKTLPMMITEAESVNGLNKDNLLEFSVHMPRGEFKRVVGVKRKEKDAVVLDLPYTSIEGITILSELCRYIQANSDLLKQPDSQEISQEIKDTSIIISSALVAGSKNPLYGSGFHLILTGTGQLGKDGVLKQYVKDYYSTIQEQLRSTTNKYENLPLFTIDDIIIKKNEVGITIAPPSPFGNNIAANTETKFDSAVGIPNTKDTAVKMETRVLDPDEYPDHVHFSPLDSRQRAGMAYARVTYQDVMTNTKKQRQSLETIFPSGWKTWKYQDNGQDKYLFHRCHLIAHSLCGEDANPANLITGTERMNGNQGAVGSMNQYEVYVADYLKLHRRHTVLYKVTPYYEGDNVLASYVIMEATDITMEPNRSLFNVKVYNTQPGWELDYQYGKDHKQIKS